jgi:hypothetical protein
MSVALDERPSAAELFPPDDPARWVEPPYETLLSIPRKDYEPLQLAALQRRFAQLKDKIAALERLTERQGVARIDSFEDALPLFFDHRVLKSYPLNIIETRDFKKLTAWLDRLTAHDLTKMDLSGLKTLDDWLSRLDDFGMIVGHSTGTTGKLSFIPRSQAEWPAWNRGYCEVYRASTGVDPTKDFIPAFAPGYRGGHQMAMRMQTLFNAPSAGGMENLHTLYQSKVSSDLMALAGRLQSAEDKGEIERLGLDPALLEARRELIEQGRRRDQDMQAWFEKLIVEFRGRRVKINGTYGDLTRMALYGQAKGLKCDFAPGSILLAGGGLKGFKDAPADYKQLIRDFFGIERMASLYGMSECAGFAPKCSCGHFHFMPYVIPIALDREARALPREGAHTGRIALFDLLAETCWGGFVSGDQATIHWDEDCGCGWKGPYLEDDITRFAEMEGGDDKITCAGSAQAYNEFMDFVMQV